MRLIIKEKNKLKEEINPKDFGGYFTYTADILPLDYLAPITPKGDYKFYKLFLNKFKEVNPQERTIQKAKEIFLSLNPDTIENVAANVVNRAIMNLTKAPFDPALAGKSSLSVSYKAFPLVVSHEGRARAFMFILDSMLRNKPLKKININLIFSDNSWENLVNDIDHIGKPIFDQILGQRMGGEKGDSLFIKKLENVKRTSS
jgi:hypothetical protein